MTEDGTGGALVVGGDGGADELDGQGALACVASIHNVNIADNH
jgi:hypothetical protein